MNDPNVDVLLKLIECVKIYPILYNRNNPDFKNRKLRDKAWENISRMCDKNVVFCRSKWKALRRYWVCTHVKNNSNNWLYYDIMNFLTPSVDQTETKETLVNDIDFNKLIDKYKNKTGKRYGNVEFTFKLIKLIMSYPQIYNQFGIEFKNAYFRSQLWKKIGNFLHTHADICRKRWNFLQTTFTKYYSSNNEPNEWIYYDAMKFTIPFLKFNNESMKIKQECDKNNISKTKQLVVRLVRLTAKDLQKYCGSSDTNLESLNKKLVPIQTEINSTRNVLSKSYIGNRFNSNGYDSIFDSYNDENDLVDNELSDYDVKIKLKICKLVSKYPSLWNKNNVNYFNENFRIRIWNCIGSDLKMNGKECSNIWNYIIEMFLKKIKYNKLLQWDLFEPLKFLLPHYKKELLDSTDNKLNILANSEQIEKRSLKTRSFEKNNLGENNATNTNKNTIKNDENISLQILKECPQYENKLKIISAQSITKITELNDNIIQDKSLDGLPIPDYKKRLRYKTITEQYKNKYNENYDSDDDTDVLNYINNNLHYTDTKKKKLNNSLAENSKKNLNSFKINPISKVNSAQTNGRNGFAYEKTKTNNLQINSINIKLERRSKEFDENVEKCGEVLYNKNNNTFFIKCIDCNDHINYDVYKEHALTLHNKSPKVNYQNGIEQQYPQNSNIPAHSNCYPEITIIPCTNINNDYLTDNNDDFEIAIENSIINKTISPRKRKKDPLKETSFFVNCQSDIQIKEEIVDSDYVSENFTIKTECNDNEIDEIISKSFECDICNREFKNMNDLKLHRSSHTSGTLYSCNFCTTKIKYKHNLKRHILTKHTK